MNYNTDFFSTLSNNNNKNFNKSDIKTLIMDGINKKNNKNYFTHKFKSLFDVKKIINS